MATSFWRRKGYEVYAIPFGWSGGPSELANRQDRLLGLFDALPTDLPISVIGGSAGGVAAINLLALRPQIHRVVTVASPFNKNDLAVWARDSRG